MMLYIMHLWLKHQTYEKLFSNPMYEEQFQAAILSLANQARRTRRDDMQSPSSPAGADTGIVPPTPISRIN